MLPFMKPKSVAGLIISKRAPDSEPSSPMEKEDSEDQGLDACSEALIRAMHAKDSKGVSAALRDAMEFLDKPEEMSNDSNSFAAQNIKAAGEQK